MANDVMYELLAGYDRKRIYGILQLCTENCAEERTCMVLSRSRARFCSRMTSAKVRTEASGVWSPIANASFLVGEIILANLRFLHIQAQR